MTNSRIGYVYLVDQNLKIRWAGCADATEEEVEALFRCAVLLIQRHKKPPKQKPPPPDRPRSKET